MCLVNPGDELELLVFALKMNAADHCWQCNYGGAAPPLMQGYATGFRAQGQLPSKVPRFQGWWLVHETLDWYGEAEDHRRCTVSFVGLRTIDCYYWSRRARAGLIKLGFFRNDYRTLQTAFNQSCHVRLCS